MRRNIPPDRERCCALTKMGTRCERYGHYYPSGLPHQIKDATKRVCGTHLRTLRRMPSRITWAARDAP